MARVLIFGELGSKGLNAGVARAVRCAMDLRPEALDVACLVASEDHEGIKQAAGLQGVQKVLVCTHPSFAEPLAAMMAPALAELARDYTHVLAANTTVGRDILPRVAAQLDVQQVSDIMRVENERVFDRPTYAGNAITTIEVPADMLVVATVRSASYRAVPEEGAATVESRSLSVTPPDHTRFIERREAKGERPDLQTARKVVSGGRAVGSAENFQLIVNLADRLGAAVGASRAAVDAGYAPNELQVGQTGKIIAPDLYVALGISGAIQHLAGIKDAGTIVAVNKDGEAPIFEVADLGLEGDLFKVIPELEKLLS